MHSYKEFNEEAKTKIKSVVKMKLEPLTKIDQINENDTLIITGHTLKNEPVTAEIVKVSKDGTEIIFERKMNRYFNLGIFLEGKSWVKELAIIK